MPKTIFVRSAEFWNPEAEEFIQTKDQKLVLEHSLVSMSKWESKWHKPFLKKDDEKTTEEVLDYIRCMTITQNVDPMVYYALTDDNISEIVDYIEDPMTATWFSDRHKEKKLNRSIMTAERIYYAMAAFNIPFSCEKWHLNRLLTLLDVCAIENAPKEKMSKNDIYAENRRLNEARLKAASKSRRH